MDHTEQSEHCRAALRPLVETKQISHIESLIEREPQYALITPTYIRTMEAWHLLSQHGIKVHKLILGRHPTFEVSHDYTFRVAFMPRDEYVRQQRDRSYRNDIK